MAIEKAIRGWQLSIFCQNTREITNCRGVAIRGWQLDNSEKAIRGGKETNRKRQLGVAIRQIGKGN